MGQLSFRQRRIGLRPKPPSSGMVEGKSRAVIIPDRGACANLNGFRLAGAAVYGMLERWG